MAPLPPLSLLRTFEAAGRHQSFRRAAAELNVTAAAVSQQMRLLEAHLGLRLFNRQARGLTLTEAGVDYLAGVRQGLAQLTEATRRLGGAQRAGRLTLGAPPSFAVHWLLPRLTRFRARYPEIEISLKAETRLADVGGGEVDLAVRFGPGRYPGLNAELLAGDRVFPACSPALLGGRSTLRRFAELLAYPLLHDMGVGPDEPSMAWATWLRDTRLGEAERPSGLLFSDAVLVMQAALVGQGVALLRGSLAADHLAAGRLVRPLPLTAATDYAYWLVARPDRAEDARVVAFMDWLREEATELRRLY